MGCIRMQQHRRSVPRYNLDCACREESPNRSRVLLECLTTKLTGAPVRARPVERIVRRQREYQPGAGQQHWHPTYGQLRAMPVERRPSAKRNPPDRQGDRNAFEQP